MAATSDLPRELMETILSKLSVKSLLRFKTVSKSWKTMITDPLFIQIHLEESMYSQNLFLFKTFRYPSHTSGRVPLVNLEDGKFQTVKLFEGPYDCNIVLCACDGVALLACESYERFALWNPSTRTSTKLWGLYINHDINHRTNLGICHDPITNDVKVVVMVDDNYYALYSCRKRQYLYMGPEHLIGSTRRDGVCVDGAIYWVCYKNNNNNHGHIVYFDPRYDVFKVLQKLPKNIVDCNGRVYVGCLRRRLCVYCYGRDKRTVHIWIKEKGIDNSSWKELITIENVETPIEWFVPLCFTENKIVIDILGQRLVVYDPSQKRFERLDTVEGFQFGLFPCPESLLVPPPLRNKN